MYAVIKTGGKQYKVAKNDVLVVERLPGLPGDEVHLKEVIALGEGEGKKFVADAKNLVKAAVVTSIVDQTRGEKIIVFKKRRRKNSRRRNGHRQELTVLRVMDILSDASNLGAPKKLERKVDPTEDTVKKPATAKPGRGSAVKKAATGKASTKSVAKSGTTKAASKKSSSVKSSGTKSKTKE
ncbi:MAG: 50S ribosomal protein L21 [Alphaproteobacteria bacterium]